MIKKDGKEDYEKIYFLGVAVFQESRKNLKKGTTLRENFAVMYTGCK